MIKGKADMLLQCRVDARCDYLLSLATAATGKTRKALVLEGLEHVFTGISLYKRQPLDTLAPASASWEECWAPDEEAVSKETHSLARLADTLWSESEYTRLYMLRLVASHLLPDEDHQLLAYVESLDKYKIREGDSYKLDRKLIDSEWNAILNAATKQAKSKARKL